MQDFTKPVPPHCKKPDDCFQLSHSPTSISSFELSVDHTHPTNFSDLSLGNLEKNICELFEEQAEKQPEAIAAIFEDSHLTYRELSQKSNQMAHYLKSMGVQPETLVGVSIASDFNLLITLLGILKAGGAYLPLDPSYPSERLQWMFEDAKPSILLTQSNLAHLFTRYRNKIISIDRDWERITLAEKHAPKTIVSPEHLAYVIYTSGSTGKPKGIMVTHASMPHLAQAHRQYYPPNIVALLTGAISFDPSLLIIFHVLIAGGTICLPKQEDGFDPEKIVHLIEDESINYLLCVPSLYALLLEKSHVLASLKNVSLAGEAIPNDLPQLHAKLAPHAVLYNEYGPSEYAIGTTLGKIYDPIEQKLHPITVGQPLPDTQVYILDSNLQIPLPGTKGEIFIGGKGLARGYLNNPTLTQEKFIWISFPDQQPIRLYRTGDYGRFLPNGNMEFLGRIDHQVKIRGIRVELGEIEHAICQYREVNEAVVVVHEVDGSNKRLNAYYSTTTSKSFQEELIAYLSSVLPKHMVPSTCIHVTQFPRTPNGKINRKALLDISEAPLIINEKGKPQTEMEVTLHTIWKQILKREVIGVHDNFFALGGDSLLMARIQTLVKETYHFSVPLIDLFRHPTISQLTHYLHSRQKQEATVSDTCSINKTITEKNKRKAKFRVRKANTYPLSSSQQRFWFSEQQTQNSSLNSLPFIIELFGALDIPSLQKALDTIVARHEILRTCFKESSEGPEQYILSEVKALLRFKDLSKYDNPEERSKTLLSVEAQKPFDVTLGPLFRFYLLRLSEKHHQFFVNFHHIVFDGHSTAILMNELRVLYETYKLGKSDHLHDLDVQYIDYTDWQSKTQNQDHASWWVKKLHDAPLVLNLPIDKPRPHTQTFKGVSVEFSIVENRNLGPLLQLAQDSEASLFMVLLTTFHVFLYRYTGQNDLVIGIPTSGRSQSNFDSLIGCFVNTLALRTSSNSENSFCDLLTRIKENSLESFERQDVPLEKILEHLKIDRTLSHSPLFQVMFNMIPEMDAQNFHDLQIHIRDLDREMAHFDLTLSIQKTPQGLLGIFEYNTDLFLKETIERMIAHFQKLVHEIIKNPETSIGHLPLLTDTEIQTQAIAWNEQPIVYSKNATILQQIEEWAESTPDAPAVICGDAKYSYHEINAQANRVAHALSSRGVKAEDKIVIYLERSAEFISGVLGILKAGGVYVPVDPTEPKERVDVILKDLCPTCILTHSALHSCFSDCDLLYIDQLPASSTHNPLVPISKEQLAYIIFTSGSTGKPKGVEIEHKSINDRVLWKNGAYPLTPRDVMLHTYSFIFDGSIINYFWPLCAGASLVIASKTEQYDSMALVRLIQKHGVTTMDLLPSLLQGLLEEREMPSCHSLRNVFSGGEALPSEVIRLFNERCSAKLHNTYGPTEATVEASAWECKSDYAGPIAPIGKPIASAKLYILDKDQNIVPIGVPGELHIGGLGLARGYLNDPLLTAEKFIPDPFSKDSTDRIYRTGDLAKYTRDGNIEFLGRIDNQVKIRGFRIDLGEIESALLHMDIVDKAIVKVRGDELHKHLIAYVVLSPSMGEKTFMGLMQHYLKERLPAHMVPQQVVILEAFPTLLNGKVNYKALPEPEHQKTPLSFSAGRECKNKLEHQLLPLWKEVLGFETIAVTDNFFEVGGNSLLAMRLIAKIRHKMGLSLPLIRLFQNPSIEALSESINACCPEKPWSSIVPMRTKGHKTPFFCVHPVGGNVLCYGALAKYWMEDRPFYTIQARGLEENQDPHESITTMAREYIRDIRQVQPTGPYVIGGWSFGGLIATEIVHQLLQDDEKISLLVLVDTSANIEKFKRINIEDESLLLAELTQHYVGEPQNENPHLSFKERFVSFLESGGKSALNDKSSMADRLIALAKANYRALQAFSIPNLNVNMVLIRPAANREKAHDLGWSKHTNKLKVFEGPGDHWAIAQDELAHYYAQILQSCFESFSDGENEIQEHAQLIEQHQDSINPGSI